jgi:hypothetical protein
MMGGAQWHLSGAQWNDLLACLETLTQAFSAGEAACAGRLTLAATASP